MAQQCKSEEYRQSPHAGTWYPGQADSLKKQIHSYLDNAQVKVAGEIFGLISPHAGYVYSGPVAAFAYQTVQGLKYDAAIIIGPSHYFGFKGASIDTFKGRITPLGTVNFDVELAKRIIKNNRLLGFEAAAHVQEHSVEIQEPFIQTVLKNVKTVEIVMGSQDYETCEILSNAIYEASKGKKILIIASS
ncbi:AmmeMemoRadiSam system protein B, partial [candidate division WOR-3 bacterium RBG_13_43_14]